MKKIKIIAVAFLIVICCVFCLSACDFDLVGFIMNNVFPYSEDGFQEINLNYAALSEDSAIFGWEITATEGEVDNSFSFKFYKDSSEGKKEMYIYQKGEVNQTVLILGAEEYYIDNTNQIVYTEKPGSFADMDTAYELMHEYGLIRLYDNQSQPIWSFVEKEEDAIIINLDGEEEETIKYTYDKIEGDVSLAVYFKKILIPTIVKLEYTVAIEEESTLQVDVYRAPCFLTIEEVDFSVPSETDGYTFADE